MLPQIGRLSDQQIAKFEELFARIAEASLQGRHLVILSRPTSQWLSQSKLPLARRHLAHFERLHQNYPTEAGLLAKAETFLTINVGSGGIAVQSENRFVVGHLSLLNSALLETPALLLVEDAHADGQFFSHVLEHSANRDAAIPKMSFAILHGGGASISKEFENRVGSGVPTVCVIDCDKRSPFDNVSVTESKLRAIANSNTYLGCLLSLPVHEIENLLPFEIVSSPMICDDASTRAKFNALSDRIGRTNMSQLWDYLDLKHGFDGAKYYAQHPGPKKVSTKNWLCSMLEISDDALSKTTLPSVGSNIISSFLKNQTLVGKFHRHLGSPEWKHKHAENFKTIAWYFCARRIQAVV